ncbi:glycoside hydrolase family 16 protein [Carboxylicivirga sp. RSCT41]|uniref:glycoside hydrolase family 16 protein n=1 Tax=Carboxylicivirga agarovorans TaxID=3417570 RepID=UPI003D357509
MRFLFVIITAFILTSCTDKDGYELVWSDEFDYKGLPDSTKWSYDTEGNAWAWGNSELQHYTAHRHENAHVDNGILSITAHAEDGYNQPYTSARLITKEKGDWLYGKVEVRAKIPAGTGLWPAIWMLPTDWEYGSWPLSGEIDIMEHVGYSPDSVFFTIHTEAYNHTKGTEKSKAVCLPDAKAHFHIYGIEWTANKCTFFLDHEKVFQYKKQTNASSSEWPFDRRFHLILNLAVGGTWGGKHGVDESVFPGTMEIDYVRVYQKK